MYAKGQREITVFGYAIFVAALFCIAGYLSSGGCGCTSTTTKRDNCGSITKQIARTERLNELSKRENKFAREAVAKADNNAERAAELNQRTQAELTGSTELVKQIRADNRRAKRILAELIGNHETGAETDKKN